MKFEDCFFLFKFMNSNIILNISANTQNITLSWSPLPGFPVGGSYWGNYTIIK